MLYSNEHLNIKTGYFFMDDIVPMTSAASCKCKEYCYILFIIIFMLDIFYQFGHQPILDLNIKVLCLDFVYKQIF